MRHRKLRRKLGVKSQHRRALLRNLTRSLVLSKRIRTTLAKAKEASAFSDSMVELAKKGDVHARRLLQSKLGCADTADLMIKQIAPHFKERKGGYTRVLKLGTRTSDGAEMALLEFTVPIELPEKKDKKKASAKKTKATDKAKTESSEAKATAAEEKKTRSAKKEEGAETQDADKQETQKRGGFLGTLRKFLKGDE